MDENQDHEKMLREMLYDVVSEVCNQMKELRNELVELQHAIHSLNDLQIVRSKGTEGISAHAGKYYVQEILK
jgi:CHAD domain-containing protein